MLGIFIDNFPPAIDGVSIGQYYTALELHRAGKELCVVTTRAEGEPYDEPFDVKRLPTVLLPNRKPYGYGIVNLPSAALSDIKQQDFEIIHCHSPFSVGHLGRKIARNNKIPFVASFHSKYYDDIYQATKNEEITELVMQRIMSFFTSADELWVADAAIVPTLVEYGYYGPVEVVPIGIDTAGMEWESARREMRERLGVTDDMPLFLYVGQQIAHKNIDLILESLSHLGDLPFHFISVGSGNGLEEFKEKAQALGIADKATFTGLVSDRPELMRYYAAADLFLFPSLYDTFGTVIREAAAMHTPSVMIAGSTCANFVEEGVTGYTAKNDPVGFAQRLEEIWGNRSQLDRVSSEVARSLGRQWSDIVNSEVIPRYERLAEKRRLYGSK